jgi:plasmid maintenance system antidote protein VapI
MSAKITRQEPPGTLLRQRYFIPQNLTIYRVAKETGIDKVALTRMRYGRQLPPTHHSVLLARYFGEADDFFFLPTCNSAAISAWRNRR